MMKKTSPIFYLLMLSVFCYSCSNDDNSNNASNNTQAEVTQLVENNSFIITSFIDSNVDETSDFACYTFEFNNDGSVTATSQNNTYNGTWSVTQSNSDDDNPNDLDFNLNFNLTNDFEDLNDDWDIVTYNSTTLELIDVSGGNGGTDSLVFQIGTASGSCASDIQSAVESNLQTGTWRITEFIDSDVDETNNFSGYDFTFNSNGVLDASNGTNSFTGTWNIVVSDSNDGTLEDLELNINFNLTNDFEDLNDDWDFISQSSTVIELTDVSGGNGDTDFLTFERN
jgi:heat shock protein HslJ